MRRRAGQRRQILTAKDLAIYAGLGIGSAAVVIYALDRFIKKLQFNRTQKDSMNEGDPATYAKQLKMAFDNDMPFGFGTNEEAIVKVFEALPSKKMYERVQQAYSRLYTRSLNADLEDELSSDEYNNLIRILNAKK